MYICLKGEEYESKRVENLILHRNVITSPSLLSMSISASTRMISTGRLQISSVAITVRLGRLRALAVAALAAATAATGQHQPRTCRYGSAVPSSGKTEA